MSIGFTVPQMVEGFTPFSAGLALYDAWMTRPAPSPRVTMVEGAVRFQLGYGYGFDDDLRVLVHGACENSHSDPSAPMPGIGGACSPTQPQAPGYLLPQTYLFARSEYAYFRFGLAFTLMRDGYFTHELGDSWHGMDWDYDELGVRLGRALGAAAPARVLSPPPPPVPPVVPLSNTTWFLWVRAGAANASWALDPAAPPFPGAPPSARVDVMGGDASADSIDLYQPPLALQGGGGYALAFWARASVDGVPLHLNAREQGGDWHSYGLDADVVLTAAWALYNVSFAAAADSGGAPARLSWWLARAPAGASVWLNSPSLSGAAAPLPVLQREFECGVALVNGHSEAVVVNLSAAPLRRLTGVQAPRVQLIVDDASPAFHAGAGAWEVVSFDSGYDENSPSSEQVRPANGFFHHWARGARRAVGGGAASFDLAVPAAGRHNVSIWFSAAVPARSLWSTAAKFTISPGDPTSTIVDLTRQGGDEWLLLFSGVPLGPGSALNVECPAGDGDCIADAVLVESEARFNDGAPAPQVELAPFDGIILQRDGAPQCGSTQRVKESEEK
jgi:hypothetical protein